MTSGPQLNRALGITAASAIVVGNVVGSGIFVKPGIIAHTLGDFRYILAAWALGGILCLCGGLCFAELGAMLPRAGGLYVYLGEAYGRLTAFLFGWNELLFNRPASTGALAVIFVQSAGALAGVELGNLPKVALSVIAILAIAAVNIRGVAWGGNLQIATTAVKVLFLLLIIALPLFAWLAPGEEPTADQGLAPGAAGDVNLATKFGVVLLAVMWAYNGWHGVSQVAEEIRRPERNIPLALLGGIALLIALYLGANLAYHSVLSLGQLAQAGEHAAEAALEVVFGHAGVVAMAAVLLISTFGTINSDLLIGSRISFAMGRDRVFFPQLAIVHAEFRTPVVAILAQAVMASLLVIGTGLLVELNPRFQQDTVFELLTNFVIFTASLFYVLGVVAVPILRVTRRETPRPYRTFGYPIVPIVFVAVYAWFLREVYVGRPFEARIGLALIALGVPAYYAYAAYENRSAARRLGTAWPDDIDPANEIAPVANE